MNWGKPTRNALEQNSNNMAETTSTFAGFASAGQAPDWNQVNPVELTGQITTKEGGAVKLATTAGDLRISISEAGVRLQAGEQNIGHHSILTRTPPCGDLQIADHDDHIELISGSTTAKINKRPFSLAIYRGGTPRLESSRDGHFARRHRVPPLAHDGDSWLWSIDLKPEESIYGLGEKWSQLNRRGAWVRSYNHDALGVNAEISYKNTPFLWSPEGWGCFAHTPAPVTHAVGYAPWSQRSYIGIVEDECLDLWFLLEDSPQDFLSRYCDLTGFSTEPPLWSLGAILSKAYYQTADELLGAARAVRDRGMSCDTITLDGRAWQDTDTRFAFEWDRRRYSKPERVINELKKLNFRVCLWEYPLISKAHPLHAQLAEDGFLIKDERTGQPFDYQWDRSPFGNVLTPLPDSGILDFTNPDAYAFWRDSHKPLFELGIDMIKADFGEQLTDPHMVTHTGESGERIHNVYALLYNRCVFEAAQKYSHTGAFLFSRCAWTGSQQFPSQWGGDPQADWGGLAASIRGALSWGLSGGPFYSSDIGGFYADERDPELYVRWTQATAFSAHLRFHGIGPREPWTYTREAEAAVNEILTLRYRLLPYLWAVIQRSCDTGVPVQRAMVLAFPEDRLAWSFEHQFMCGDDLLVAPCIQAGGNIRFYLPEGSWTRFPSGEIYSGGR
ncbi:MAG: TIM-barrel domain-containing protein, partial [Pseudomonadota bacterium]